MDILYIEFESDSKTLYPWPSLRPYIKLSFVLKLLDIRQPFFLFLYFFLPLRNTRSFYFLQKVKFSLNIERGFSLIQPQIYRLKKKKATRGPKNKLNRKTHGPKEKTLA